MTRSRFMERTCVSSRCAFARRNRHARFPRLALRYTRAHDYRICDLLDIPTQSLDTPYTYVVPDHMVDAEVGCAVLVSFGNRKAVGFIVAIGEDEARSDVGADFTLENLLDDVSATARGKVARSIGSRGALDSFVASTEVAGVPTAASGYQGAQPGDGAQMPLQTHFGFGAQYEAASPETGFAREHASNIKIKPIERVLSKPDFDEEGAACASFLARRYLAPLSSCVRLFTPPGGVARMVRSRDGSWRLEEPAVGEVDDRWVTLGPAAEDFAPRKNAVKQAAVVEALRRGDLRMAELSLEFGAVSSTVKTLESKGVVRVERRRRMRGAALPSEKGVGAALAPKPRLTAGQSEALSVVNACVERAQGEVVLVDGVTGSGKTEVYLQAIEGVLARGRNAIVLVPEISLTPQTVARFRGRFGDAVAVMHWRISQGERYDQWDFVKSGEARVVVGARSALFTPMKNVGLIVIDEEHEGLLQAGQRSTLRRARCSLVDGRQIGGRARARLGDAVHRVFARVRRKTRCGIRCRSPSARTASRFPMSRSWTWPRSSTTAPARCSRAGSRAPSARSSRKAARLFCF